MPFPTRANPNKPKSAWEQGYTYDNQGAVGQDPGDVLPGSDRDARLAALTRAVRERRPQHHAAGQRHLDIRWLLPDQSTRPGATLPPKAGIDLAKYPRAIDAPREVQDAAAKALRETRGMQPWASNKPLMAAVGGQDTVIPSGPRLQRSDSVATCRRHWCGSGTALQRHVIPGLGITPEALATLNAMLDGRIKSRPVRLACWRLTTNRRGISGRRPGPRRRRKKMSG